MALACAKSAVLRLEKSLRPVRYFRTSFAGHVGSLRSSERRSLTCRALTVPPIPTHTHTHTHTHTEASFLWVLRLFLLVLCAHEQSC